jgi:non-heme chloroperoxidase
MKMDAPTIKESTIDKVAVRFGMMQLATGIEMHYAEYGDPDGEPIVFLHGTSDSWFSFSPVLKYLSPKYHVYMLDQRGHGNSSKPEAGYKIADFAADAIAFIRALRLEQVTLIGHSMGSFIAQRVAVTAAPELAARLVLVDSATDPRTDDLMGFLEVVKALQDPVPEAFSRDFQMSTIYNALPDAFMSRVISESMKLPAYVWRAVFSDFLSSSTVSPFERIQVPTLVVWGDRDMIWSRAEQEALATGIPQAELHIYPETGHALHWERPEEFARQLEDFITRTV